MKKIDELFEASTTFSANAVKKYNECTAAIKESVDSSVKLRECIEALRETCKTRSTGIDAKITQSAATARSILKDQLESAVENAALRRSLNESSLTVKKEKAELSKTKMKSTIGAATSDAFDNNDLVGYLIFS